jgi:homocysteine S-methyltransferase
VFDVDAIGLVNIVSQLNRGLDLGGSEIGIPTRFCVGVGANPVAVDMDRERKRFRHKVEAGAEWSITQPIFDSDALFQFLEFAAPLGIPVIAGIWPLRSLRNAEFMANEVPGVRVPPEILTRMARWTSSDDQLKEGLAIAREIIDRVRPAVRGLQLSAPLGQVELLDSLLGPA